MLAAPLYEQFKYEDRLPHIVYDLSIEDLAKRKEKAKVFDNAQQVADYLGCTLRKVFNNRAPGKRIKSNFMNREFAVRIQQEKKAS